MRQFHKNLFAFYRGARPADSGKDLFFERQLEDNVTKALIYLLEQSDRSQVLSPFLQEVAGIRSEPNVESVQFVLQRSDIARPRIPERVALAIAPERGLVSNRRDDHQSGRPDAWLWEENSFAILLENKIVGQASRQQVRRHITGAAGWRRKAPKVRTVSWGDVSSVLSRVRHDGRSLDSVTRLLLDEFLEYLRMTGLAAGTTFQIEDFTMLMQDPEDQHPIQRSFLHQKLVSFTRALAASRDIRKIIGLYGGKAAKNPSKMVNPGLFRKKSKSPWITIGPKKRRDRAHLTVRIGESGIVLDAFSPHRSFTRRFIGKIERNPDGFLATLRRIPRDEPWLIRLREAYYAKPGSSYKGQQINKAVDYLEVHPRAVDRGFVLDWIVGSVRSRYKRKKLRPEIFLVRRFPVSELLGNHDVVDLVGSAAKQMAPYLRFALDL